MPLEDRQPRPAPGQQPIVGSLGRQLQRVPADLLEGIGRDPSAECLGQQLGPQANPQHGQTQADRLPDPIELRSKEGEFARLIDVHRAAKHDQAGRLCDLYPREGGAK